MVHGEFKTVFSKNFTSVYEKVYSVNYNYMI